MPKIRDKEYWVQLFESKSLILNPTPTDPRIPPHNPGGYYGLNGLKEYLDEILNDEISPEGVFQGRLAHARYEAREARSRWKAYNDAQPFRESKPTGEFAEKIAMWEARVAVYEKESRRLHRMIEEEKERLVAERQKRLTTKTGRRLRLAGKMKNGRLVSFAGRPVMQRGGQNLFEDDGSPVDEYIARVKAEKLAELKAKKRRASACCSCGSGGCGAAG